MRFQKFPGRAFPQLKPRQGLDGAQRGALVQNLEHRCQLRVG